MIADVTVCIELDPDVISLVIGQWNPFERLAAAYGTKLLINLEIILRQLCHKRIFFVGYDRIDQRHTSSPRFMDVIAPSPNRRIAIALQMSLNAFGGTRLLSARSLTVRQPVPRYKSFAAQNRG